MLKNNILITFRNIKKHKFFAGINIIGLSLSMSVCLILILLVHDHFQYDKFHSKGDRIFRVTTYTNGQEGTFDQGYATSPMAIKGDLNQQYAFVETITNLNHLFRGEIRSPHKIFEIRALFADEDFFNVFEFKLLEGTDLGLSDPFNILLSESMSNKLFPNQSAVGQTVEFEDHGSYKVIGVVKNPPGNTHMEFEALASYSSIPHLVEKGILSESYKDWDNIWYNYNYLVLNNAESRDKVEEVINQIAFKNMEQKDDHPGYVFRLQALNEIVPGRTMSNEISFALPWFALAFFALLGFIVMITATINYTNLSIAKSLSRTKEIGIRKVSGARRSHIIYQFLVESIVIALISLVFAIFIYKGLLQSFNELWIFSMIGIELTDSWIAYFYFLGFTLLLGIFTGIGPSIFLSRMDTIKSLKGSVAGIRRKKKSVLSFLTGRRTLLSIQFSLSIIMLISIITIKDQADFLVGTNFGFEDDKVFYIETQGHDPLLVKQEFSTVPGVDLVSFTSHHPAVGRSYSKAARWKKDQESLDLSYFSVDSNYLDVMGLNLIAGSDFPKNSSSQNEKFTILNELAIKTFGFETAAQAIGESIFMDSLRLVITGVVKDYHWEPLMKPITPLALRITPESYVHAYFKLSNVDAEDYKKVFEEKWLVFDPSREFKGGYLDAQLDEFYQFFYDLGSILGYVAVLAVTISSLGFLGMISFELKTKVKEIGIRKVLGASFSELTYTLSKSFLIMILLTSLLAVPLALFLNGLWVNQMASHVPLGFLSAVPAILIIGSICLSAILSQVWVNSRRNPADTLRTD